MSPEKRAQEILSFWFKGDPTVTRSEWFVQSDFLDTEITQRFLKDLEAADQGEYDALKETPQGCLALILLFDQFPRNMFRNQARAFHYDSKAKALSRHCLKEEYDQEMSLYERLFLYLPFEHSEILDVQDYAVSLFESLGNADLLAYAQEHQTVIQKFGRFPTRNAALGRPNTEEEAEYLKEL